MHQLKDKKVWRKNDIEPRAIDREIATVMHSTHIGCSADIDSLINLSLRTSMADGWQGSMIGTQFSDIMFGTPTPQETEANLGVLEENKVNIILHGHEPSLSEMIVLAAEDPELVSLAKEVGAEGINISGMCCTGNEITMRHGSKNSWRLPSTRTCYYNWCSRGHDSRRSMYIPSISKSF